ncbi:MAG: UDP-N-acetylmuramoyl-L-alanine--D-glutamate ligase [Patescibacteria group bacterium]|nr:UDP-N-acetylmuramoyl-L-alanine--D-glutamate ligase [Patescibacteria group bacterium]
MVKQFQGKKVLLMGLGLHGGALAVLEWLLKNKAILTVTDLKNRSQLRPALDKIKFFKGSEHIRYTLGRHDVRDFKDQDLIIQNPGVPRDSIYLAEAKKNNIPIINEAVMFFGLYPGRSIGVTGTRGKSSTATLIHQIIKTEIKSNVVTGNIATSPMLAALDKLKVKSLPVVELSSWQLEKMDEYRVSPHIAVVTNVLKDHLNTYANFAAYKNAKRAIVRHQVKSDICVLNFDNTHSRSFVKDTKARVYFYSTGQKVKGAYLAKGNICFYNGRKSRVIMSAGEFKLLGEHNLQNALAAIAVAKIVGIKDKNIAKAVSRFKGVDYRLQYKANIDGVDIYNDSTATNPDATIAALRALAGKKILLIAGGMDKNMDYRLLAREIKKGKVFLLLLDGSASDKLLLELRRIRFPKSRMIVGLPSLEKAWGLAWVNSRGADCLLLSPAAASFNMFINEFDRARQFDKLINDSQKKKK